MDETKQISEKHVFFSARKEVETMGAFLETLLMLPVHSLAVQYTDRPEQVFGTFNARSKKLILSLSDPQKIERIHGEFTEGGCFELRSKSFSITISADEYNFEVIDTMRQVLSPIFPLCIMRNPYIWGVDLYLNYERESFFELRKFTFRSQKLEEPQIDVFRRDDGIIFKIRFHLREEHNEITIDRGLKMIHEVFEELLEAIKKGSYESLEVILVYCNDLPAFRRFEPRTKIGQRVKSLLNTR